MASRYLLFSKDLIILADTVPSSAPRIPDRRFLFSSPIHFLSLGLGSGLSPKAPGTAGSLAAVPLYVLLYWVLPAQLIFMLCIPLFVLGIWLCQRTTQALGVDDHPAIVWDEMVAVWLVLAALPTELAWNAEGIAWVVIGVALFRLFDIWKPAPIRQLDQNIGGGLGIMLDDLAAAAYTLLACYLGKLLFA
jgi:phosphatidylglycerophosphatase A